jgi:hypothetical protein
MTEPITYLAVGSLALIGLGLALFVGLKGWQGWLDLKRLELTGQPTQQHRSPAMERIEIADLKERIRKLESIASCVDL